MPAKLACLENRPIEYIMDDLDPPAFDRLCRLQHVTNILSAEVDGELVIMDVEKGLYFGLDAIGTEIWKRLETPTTVAELSSALALEFEADAATIRHDLLALLDELVRRRLVAVC